ncbi:hypothetical protein [Lihuaxuella thermophila]|nr:hypothetical protein [Lihuaxuella thermophila]
MAYSPTSSGSPGEVYIDVNASISALRHEYQHFLDDMAEGWPGMRGLYDLKSRTRKELRAYLAEIREAEKLGYKDVVDQLWNNYREERQQLIDLLLGSKIE